MEIKWQYSEECTCHLQNSYAWLPRKCDYRTDRWTADNGQSDHYVQLCFAGDIINNYRAWPFIELWEFFIDHLQRIWHANTAQGTLTPPVTWSRLIWDLHASTTHSVIHITLSVVRVHPPGYFWQGVYRYSVVTFCKTRTIHTKEW